MELSRLDERCLIRVSGDDAATFLQNLLTQDVLKLEEGRLAYGCLLTPQGRVLHDLFIFRKDGDFFLDCETARSDDLLRRFRAFRLRAKVAFEPAGGKVYAGDRQAASLSFADPRLEGLGERTYTEEKLAAGPATLHKDRRIHLGVPEGSIDMRPDADIMADVNLDLLHAVAWDKGCFVGQEVTARVNWRGLVKRRLLVVAGAGLKADEAVTTGDRAVGEVRSVNSAGTEGLALLRLDSLNAPLAAGSSNIVVHRPDWLKIDIKVPV